MDDMDYSRLLFWMASPCDVCGETIPLDQPAVVKGGVLWIRSANDNDPGPYQRHPECHDAKQADILLREREEK